MSEVVHTSEELKDLQALPLYLKVMLTKARIREWIHKWGEDGVYVSFSGGKDSTVLLHIVREEFPDVEGVFCNTGLEYPEIVAFIKDVDNIRWLKPKKNFRQIISDYGYPFISKEISGKVYEARSKKGGYAWRTFHGSKAGTPYDMQKYKWLLDCPYPLHNYCCHIMKKFPAKAYEKETDKHPMLAQMTCESRARRTSWLKNGCNGFDMKRPMSNPMSFWTEQDVLQYIKEHNIQIASIYGDIVEDKDGKLHTTGVNRTGCIFCGYGCQREKPGEGKFELLKESHPQIYEWIMKPWDEGGLGYKELIDWLNENGNLHIKY